MSVILDASAVLALLFDEPGADYVLEHGTGGRISTVNLVEILAKCAAQDIPAKFAKQQMARLDIAVCAFSVEEAQIAADLVPYTRGRGLSLADRACLALATLRKVPVLTADRDWAALDIGVDIRLIR